MAEVDRDPTPEEEPLEESHVLSDFFHQWEGRSGLYFLSPYFTEELPDQAYPVKVGMSRHRTGRSADPNPNHRHPYGGLGRRMDSYLLCFVRGFYVYSVLQCARQNVYQMEKFFHEYFTSKGFQMPQHHSHREEWFMLTRTDLFATIKAYDRAFPGTILDYEVFLDMPQFVDTNGRLAAHPKKSMPSEQKQMLEDFMSPGRVPQTQVKRKKLQAEIHENESDNDGRPVFTLDNV